MSCRTRFAPSPTGFLHLGHAYSALTAFEAACAHSGDFVLRLEDIDHIRCKEVFETAIMDDLAWLGLTWEQPVLRQSQHKELYFERLMQLKAMGLLYADLKTRKGDAERALSAPQDDESHEAGQHGGQLTSPNLAAPAWRLSLEATRRLLGARFDDLWFCENGKSIRADPSRNGDVILGRKDIGIAYHLCSVIDDARQGITHIYRGYDLLEATHTQVLLQTLLDLPTPSYQHHPLLLDSGGQRLAKRKGSKSLKDYREAGLSVDQVKGLISETPKSLAPLPD